MSGSDLKNTAGAFTRKESMIKAPAIFSTLITLKFGEACASAKVKRIRPTTKSTADLYSKGGYFHRMPGMRVHPIMRCKP